jgi:4-hydroxybenzoyl-CoA reductase subunit alpha
MSKIETVLVESLDPNGPYGVKEASMAIAQSAAAGYNNAIGDDLGIWTHHFPFTPEKI